MLYRMLEGFVAEPPLTQKKKNLNHIQKMLLKETKGIKNYIFYFVL